MNTNIFNARFWFLTALVLLAVATRFLHIAPNFTSIGAFALFGGACFSDKRTGFIIPLVAMFLSDMIIGFHNTMPYVYGSILLTSYMGLKMRNNVNVTNVLTGSLGAAIVFFVITNFGYWAANGFQLGAVGLWKSYIDAIPFFGYMVAGDLFYSIIMFGILYLAEKQLPVLAKQKA